MAEDEELKKIIPRINELAHKAKSEGLTTAETAEQEKLRRQYLERFKSNFRNQVELTRVFDKNGNEITSEKVKEVQRNKDLRDN
ncbi:hypothetical protein B808_198 [Fructilactobacillus florum 8D]|uniref:UPF0291 protein B808_198 n=2 Tax=Fructilactobacillus florum TaxID=640331 RepID=W9EFN1_9LACO|nr:DUF896 domain-containing protein [Fructilactobacillus florum]EKK20233.1 hypothetical protein B807_1043 [Fructilactobacillus florum 2F]ETO40918.1 hypothetical protein B808_198 [Fructilactobacillus florum 8D]KRM91379.1 hypothetical protein FC87_GL000890 [Fructilactobacillus florum DSM 22689 = JCM 16035]